MTDGEYAKKLRELAGGQDIRWVVVDPSAASFLELLRRDGWHVVKAENDVLSGIRLTAEYLKEGRIVICSGCRAALREFQLYCWDTRPGSGDRVVKQHDHAMDDIRYFAVSVAGAGDGSCFGGLWVERSRF